MKIYAIAITAMLLCLFAYPAAATSVYESLNATTYYIPWGNGQDTNGNGVIDDANETTNGTVPINTSKNTISTWYQTFLYPGPPSSGVQVAPYIEQIYQVESNTNISVSPLQTCYKTSPTNAAYGHFFIKRINYELVSNVLNVCTFYVQLPATAIMTGAQEFWYRSPLVWNDPSNPYTAHYLNIYDDTNTLVWASVNDTYARPNPKYATDTSNIGAFGGERVYYIINTPFHNTKYRFEEYVSTAGNVPVNAVQLYMSPAQDIANDGFTDTYCFLGTNYSRKVPFEAAWSSIFTKGIGAAGTDNIILSGSQWTKGQWPRVALPINPHVKGEPMIISQTIYGAMNNVGSVEITFPLRTSTPLDLAVMVATQSGGLTFGDYEDGYTNLTGVTGTFTIRFDIHDPDIAAKNNYTVMIRILNFNASGDGMAFYMYPQYGAISCVTTGNFTAANHLNNTIFYNNFALHCEITEYAGSASNQAFHSALSFLLGLALLILGILLTVFTFGAGLGLVFTVAGVAVGSTAVAFGTYVVLSSGMLTPLINGVLRVLILIGTAVSLIAGALWSVAVVVLETIVHIGEQILYYGAMVMEAIWQVIWLIAFLVVIWVWMKFLDIMKWITLGDPSKALGTIQSTGSQSVAVVNRYGVRPGKRVYRGASNTYQKAKKKHWYSR